MLRVEVAADGYVERGPTRLWVGVISAKEEAKVRKMLALWTTAPNLVQGELFGARFKTGDGRGLLVHGSWTECEVIAVEGATVAKLVFAFDRWREW